MWAVERAATPGDALPLDSLGSSGDTLVLVVRPPNGGEPNVEAADGVLVARPGACRAEWRAVDVELRRCPPDLRQSLLAALLDGAASALVDTPGARILTIASGVAALNDADDAILAALHLQRLQLPEPAPNDAPVLARILARTDVLQRPAAATAGEAAQENLLADWTRYGCRLDRGDDGTCRRLRWV